MKKKRNSKLLLKNKRELLEKKQEKEFNDYIT
jgi:hypothetical protein